MPRSCACPATRACSWRSWSIANVDKTPVDTRTANPGTAHLAFFTRRLRCAVRGADRQGCRLRVSPPVTPTIGPNTGGRAVYMIDPDGIRVEFITSKLTFDGKPNV